jgi:hypothetical protein
MKKIKTLFLPLILLINLAQANDEKLYSFIGIQTSVTQFEDTTAPTIGLRYGMQSSQVRTTIAYDYGKNSNNSYHTLIMQMDTGILSNTFANSNLKPYMGASLGLMQHNNSKNTSSQRDRGYLYGINAGLTYIVNDAIDLDVGYKFLNTAKLENIDTINDLTFAMHYFY